MGPPAAEKAIVVVPIVSGQEPPKVVPASFRYHSGTGVPAPVKRPPETWRAMPGAGPHAKEGVTNRLLAMAASTVVRGGQAQPGDIVFLDPRLGVASRPSPSAEPRWRLVTPRPASSGEITGLLAPELTGAVEWGVRFPEELLGGPNLLDGTQWKAYYEAFGFVVVPGLGGADPAHPLVYQTAAALVGDQRLYLG